MPSFSVVVGTSPTPLVSPAWVNLTEAYTVQTSGFSVSTAMLGILIPYNSASPGNVTIPSTLPGTPNATFFVGQFGAGAATVVAGGGVTLTGEVVTPGQYSVLQVVQTSAATWVSSLSSLDMTQFSGNPNGSPLLVAYEQITVTNIGTPSVTVDINSNVAAGVSPGVTLSTGQSEVWTFKNAPSQLLYAVAASATSAVSVVPGAAP